MRRSKAAPAAAIVATAVGLGVILGYHPSGGTATLPASVKVGATAGVGAGVSAVGTDQTLAGGLGDIQVRVSAQNGKITSVGLAKLNVHGPQSAQITGLEWPRPGSGVFQTMFRELVTFQTAGVTSSAMPQAPGPRKDGQLSCPKTVNADPSIQHAKRRFPIWCLAHDWRGAFFLFCSCSSFFMDLQVVLPSPPRRGLSPAMRLLARLLEVLRATTRASICVAADWRPPPI